MSENKLWILRPVSESDPHWEPWYEKAFGFVIRAESEESARLLADSDAGDENDNGKHPWLSREHSTCVELSPDGETEIVIKDFAGA